MDNIIVEKIKKEIIVDMQPPVLKDRHIQQERLFPDP